MKDYEFLLKKISEKIKEELLPQLSMYSPPISRLSNLLQRIAHRTTASQEPILRSFSREDEMDNDGYYYIHDDIINL